MEDVINLEFLETSRKKIEAGDVFVYKPKSNLYYWGIVVNSKAKLFSAENLIHIQLFDKNEEQSCYFSLDYLGKFSVISYLNIDNLISTSLNISLAVYPPSGWNPYFYKEIVKEKYPQYKYPHCRA